ncbi:phenylalanine--tRNA ligase subunit beta, partial [Candidatus Bathyarchaeota archaeon]|nr:phenylalanine--tRNA ligase subunit beta [Candidatus Bathyarchaeota archaeon]
RSWLLPNLMAFLSNNLHMAYPQKIFEVGDCVVLEPARAKREIRDVRKLAAVVAHSSASFSELKMIVEAFFTNLGAKPKLKESKHPSFIAGRVGDLLIDGIYIGVAGELAPPVLDKWGLSNPVVGFEIDLASILKVLK